MTMQHPRPWLLPQHINRGPPPVYPETKNRSRFTKTVTPTLATTLIKIQNRHPPGTRITATRPSSERALPYPPAYELTLSALL